MNEILIDDVGPIDVIGDSPAGALDPDLRAAALRALTIPREVARAHAERYSWEACTRQFLSYLHPIGVGSQDGDVALRSPAPRSAP